MKPELILHSDLLDILFNNRNKAYGAYTLRKDYNNRLLKALSVTGLVVLAVSFFSLYNFRNNDSSNSGHVIMVDTITLQPTPVRPPKQEPLQKKYAAPVRERIFVTPQIVKDNLVDKEVPKMDDLAEAIISDKDVDGKDATPADFLPAGDHDVFITEKPIVPEPIIEETGPLTYAEVMPTFPGGPDAFLKFMLRNLRQPDNLEAGEKIVVRVKFVVGADGSIQEADILQSGGELDREVLRVVNKMPNWTPGKQGGKNVPVYFQLPVTFVAGE